MLGGSALVNSYHHQCVSQLGSELVAVAHASDGVIEAIELPGADLLAVQWHPEMLREPDPVFDWLVQSCYNLEESETEHALA
jgi:putative glutamine amidotransferase